MPGLEIRRRSSRLLLRIPVVLEGTNHEHEPFHERAETIDVGKFGAKLLTAQRLRMGSQVLLRRVNSEHAEPFRVVHIGDPDPETRKYPVGLETTTVEDFWGHSFPPDAWP